MASSLSRGEAESARMKDSARRAFFTPLNWGDFSMNDARAAGDVSGVASYRADPKIEARRYVPQRLKAERYELFKRKRARHFAKRHFRRTYVQAVFDSHERPRMKRPFANRGFDSATRASKACVRHGCVNRRPIRKEAIPYRGVKRGRSARHEKFDGRFGVALQRMAEIARALECERSTPAGDRCALTDGRCVRHDTNALVGRRGASGRRADASFAYRLKGTAQLPGSFRLKEPLRPAGTLWP